MIRTLADGIELDDSKERIDREAVHRYLSEVAYWSLGRARETQDRLIESAARVVGLYDRDRQIGFCRAASDGTSFVYLADVYVIDEYRGRGLGLEMVREIVDNGELAKLRWLLHTRDMHRVYRKVGFGAPGERLMERPAP